MVVVSAPASSWELTMPAATSNTSQIATVRHGLLALARAKVSVPNDIIFSCCFAALYFLHCKHTA
jgi:hypothetical protein